MTEWERPSLSSGSNSRVSRPRSAKPHRLRWIIIAAALLGTVAFGWASWSAYRSAGPTGSGIVPLLKADSEPTRIRPDNPGGMPIPNQDKAIYDKLDPRRAPPSGVERLLPPPESPVSRPAAVAAKAPEDSEPAAKPAIPSLGETTQTAAREVGTATVKAPVEPELPPAPPSSAAAPSPFTKLEAPPPPAKSAPKAATPAPREQTAAVSPSSPPAAKAVPEVKVAGPGMRVQLGAVGSEDAAHKEWERIRRANGDLLGALSPAFVRADLGAKGIVYRIQAGPVGGADAAADLCAKLKARNVGCFVAR